MKLISFKALLVVGLLVCVASTHAQSVTFNLTGTINPGVCVFAANNVDLGTWNATDFTAVGTTKPFYDVTVTSSRCDPLVTSIHMRVSGTADAASAALFRGVTGIGIELQQKTPATAVVPAGTTVNFTPVAGAGTYLFQARFKQSAATVGSGTVSSPVTIAFTYN
jgi:type 1 fimbria pilin